MPKYQIKYRYYPHIVLCNSKQAAKNELKKTFSGMVLPYAPYRWSDDWAEIDLHDSGSDLEAMVTRV